MNSDLPRVDDSYLEFSILNEHAKSTEPIKYCKLEEDQELVNALEYLGQNKLIHQPVEGVSTIMEITPKGRDVLNRGILYYHLEKLTNSR